MTESWSRRDVLAAGVAAGLVHALPASAVTAAESAVVSDLPCAPIAFAELDPRFFGSPLTRDEPIGDIVVRAPLRGCRSDQADVRPRRVHMLGCWATPREIAGVRVEVEHATSVGPRRCTVLATDALGHVSPSSCTVTGRAVPLVIAAGGRVRRAEVSARGIYAVALAQRPLLIPMSMAGLQLAACPRGSGFALALLDARGPVDAPFLLVAVA